MLTIYLLIAAGITLLVMEPWIEEISVSNLLLGLGVGLAWPLIAIVALFSYLFLAVALGIKRG